MLLLAHYNTSKNETKKKGVEEEMLKMKKTENYEAMIENRNILIANLKRKNEELTKENLALYEENKDLRFENDEQTELINKIEKLVSSNKYNNEKVFTGKIKELVSDWQSIN